MKDGSEIKRRNLLEKLRSKMEVRGKHTTASSPLFSWVKLRGGGSKSLGGALRAKRGSIKLKNSPVSSVEDLERFLQSISRALEEYRADSPTKLLKKAVQIEGPYLKVSDVARILGVSTRTVYRYLKAGGIPVFRTPNGHYRIPKDKFKEWFLQKLREQT